MGDLSLLYAHHCVSLIHVVVVVRRCVSSFHVVIIVCHCVLLCRRPVSLLCVLVSCILAVSLFRGLCVIDLCCCLMCHHCDVSTNDDRCCRLSSGCQ